jgi:hypothetical protein
MGSFGLVFVDVLRCAWELPLAANKTITKFAEQTGSIQIFIAILTAFALLITFADPVSLGAGFAEVPTPADYSLGNLVVVLFQNMILSFGMLLFAGIVVYLLNGPYDIGRFAYSRLPLEGFVAIWFGLLNLVEGQLLSPSVDILLMGITVFVLAAFVYFLQISYRVGGALPPLKAMTATGIEFLTIIVLVWFLNSQGAPA